MKNEEIGRLLVFCLSLVAWWILVAKLTKFAEPWFWTATTGTILEKRVEMYFGDTWGRRVPAGVNYIPVISFRYRVDDREIVSERFKNYFSLYNSFEAAEIEMTELAQGSQVRVLYDPDSPETSCVSILPSRADIFWTLILSVAAVSTLIVFIWPLWKRH